MIWSLFINENKVNPFVNPFDYLAFKARAYLQPDLRPMGSACLPVGGG